MDYQIGKKIKELRKYLHLTQKELAHNICTQAMISKIENDEDIHISAQMLHQFSKRLGVPIEYFFQEMELPNLSYVNEVCDQLNALIRTRNYDEAYQIVKLEKRNPLFNTKPHLKRYLLWREAICFGYLEKNKPKAIALLDDALSLSDTSNKNLSLEELDILTSKAIFLSELAKWKEAKDILEYILHYLTRIFIPKDKTTIINIYYNASRTSFMLKEYNKSLSLCTKGINLCLSENTFYMLGYLYYQKAETLIGLNNKVSEDTLKIYEEALWIFSKTGDSKNVEHVKNKLEDQRKAHNLVSLSQTK